MANLVEVFDPPMCCSSGVCGPKVDNRLVQFSVALEWLRSQGVQVKRYNPTQQYEAFVNNPMVVGTINAQGTECLPLILVDGKVVNCGGYPLEENLAVIVGIESQPEAEA